jgi:hypothetical protein
MTPVKKEQPDYRAWRGLDLDDVQVDRPRLPKSWLGAIVVASAFAVISVIVIPAVTRNPQGGLENKRHEMNPRRYDNAGGDF